MVVANPSIIQNLVGFDKSLGDNPGELHKEIGKMTGFPPKIRATFYAILLYERPFYLVK